MKFRRELLCRSDVPEPAGFGEIPVRHQFSQELAIQVNDRITPIPKGGSKRNGQGGLSRARLTGEPVDHGSQILRLIHRAASAFDEHPFFSRSTTAGFSVNKVVMGKKKKRAPWLARKPGQSHFGSWKAPVIPGLGADLPELRQARAFWQLNRFDDSLRLFEEAARKYPQNLVALIDGSRALSGLLSVAGSVR